MQRDDSEASLTDEQQRAAEQGAKAMMPIGRPFLDYVLSALADAGITRVCLVVPPDHAAIRRYYEQEVRPTRVGLWYAVQAEPLGTADAVRAAQAFCGEDPFLVLNGDNYYPIEACRALTALGAPAVVGFERDALIRLGNIDAERISRYALLRVADDGTLTDLVEKPDADEMAAFGPAALVSMNLWAFGPAIFDACAAIGPSLRGELELPDAVRDAIRRQGVGFRVLPCAAAVLDLASRRDVEPVTGALAGVTVHL